MTLQELTQDIKSKQELAGLDQDFVMKRLQEFFRKHEKSKKALEAKKFNRKSKEYKEVIKAVRKELREVYGVFILKKYKKRYDLLKKLEKSPSLENHNQLLALHQSTKERLPYYTEIYKKIFNITGKPKSILDLACGLNPVSYPYLGCKPKYSASELSLEDSHFIQDYFDAMKIDGLAFQFNLLDFKKTKMSGFIKADMCFLLKTLDSLETIKRNISKTLIQGLPAKHIVVSFPTMSLGGKKAIKSRNWFKNLLKNIKLEFDTFSIPGEDFFVIHK